MFYDPRGTYGPKRDGLKERQTGGWAAPFRHAHLPQ